MLEIKFTVDLSDRVMSAIEELTRSVRSTNSPVAPIEEAPNIKSPAVPKAEAPKAEAPKAEAPKAEAPKAEAPKAEAPKAEAPKAEAPKAEAPKAEGSTNLKVEDVRALLRAKVNNDLNRDKLKTKLDSYGAANVTALAKEHYDDFYKFMQTLP